MLIRSGFGLAGIVVAAGLGMYVFATRTSDAPESLATADKTALGPAAREAALTGPMIPSFDVVRVGPQGNAVIAGRAEPGAEVIVRDGGTEVARTRADQRGEFVALPAAPLPSGGSELTLASRGAGGPEVKGDGSVLVAPPAAAPNAGAVALLVPKAAPPRVLQDPERREKTAALSLDVVDYDDKGGIRFTGNAAAGGDVRVYVDNGPVGDKHADAAGRWSVAPGDAVAPGVHTLRVDQLDARGRVMGRVEVPFQRADLKLVAAGAGAAAAAPGTDRVVVQPGQSLWRLARVAYGRGAQYSVIYLANRGQIRDPSLIYPGQAFAVPAP